MATMQRGALLRQFDRIFGAGTVAGLADGPLLARFLDRRDEAAFAALVERHGPMVRATCRAVLRDEHDAADAFQATFLVLVRKAGTVRQVEALGAWLHRVATRARREASRRRVEERRALATRAGGGTTAAAGDDLGAALHAEIDRLPGRYRLPVVLCHLEGLTHAEAAGRLCWSEGTLRGRLTRGRLLLRSRLARRGIAAPAGLIFAGLAREASAKVPDAWLAAARAATGRISAGAAAALAGRVLLAAKLKSVAAAALGLAALAAFGLLAATSGRPDTEGHDPGPPAGASRPAAARGPVPNAGASAPEDQRKDRPGETVEVRGRVVDEAGRPLAGATLRLEVLDGRKADGPGPGAMSGPDGRFTIRAPRRAFEAATPRGDQAAVQVVATAPGFGPDWVAIEGGPDAPEEATLRLVADDVPIDGRVLDLEGRPVAGAVIKTTEIGIPPGGDLAPWIEALKAVTRRPRDGIQLRRRRPWELSTTTGPDGRFRLEGIGRERFVRCTISGPTVEISALDAMTRDVPTFRAPNGADSLGGETLLYHGARFDHAAAPGTTIAGVVRDRDTGTPLAGVRVWGVPHGRSPAASLVLMNATGAITDDQGRYRLVGLPRAGRYQLTAAPVAAGGSPYRPMTFDATIDAPGLAPATYDVGLERNGTLIRGRLLDKATGRPVRGSVDYFPFEDNPRAKAPPGGSFNPMPVDTDDDGRFTIHALPGHGLLTARANDDHHYRVGVGAETIAGIRPNGSLPTLPGPTFPKSANVLAEVNPEVGAGPTTCDLLLDPGRAVSLSLVDPDGTPVADATAWGLHAGQFRSHPQPRSATLEATGLDPRSPRRIDFFHPGRKLAGSILVRGDEPSPVTVRLRHCGVVTGRIVDEEGASRTRVELASPRGPFADPDRGDFRRRHAVDRDGRFRIEVVPGVKYSAYALGADGRGLGDVFEDLKLGPGEVKDLGDVRLK